MSTYYGTYGQKVQYLASDPSDPQTGQVWYNSTSATLKVRQLGTVNAFASGGNLPGSLQGAAGFGTQTAGLIAGGNPGPGPSTAVLLYNGTSWSPTTAFNTNRSAFGAIGVSQTAGIIMGGYEGGPTYSTATESWNGSSWTTVNTLNISRGSGAAIGTSVAGLWGVGDTPAGDAQTSFSAWNGTSWTSAPNTNTGRNGSPAAFGTQTAGLIAGGRLAPPSNTNATELYNGTSWTSNPTGLNTTRRNMGSAGTQTAGLAFGGATNPSLVPEVLTGATELWNGTSWTSNPTGLATARRSLASVGTSSLAFGAGGYNAVPGITSATEEWSGIVDQTKTVTVS
jgi:hypothetical protein